MFNSISGNRHAQHKLDAEAVDGGLPVNEARDLGAAPPPALENERIPSGAAKKQEKLSRGYVELTLKNVAGRVDLAAESASGPLEKRAQMLLTAGKWLKPLTDAQMEAAVPKDISPFEQGLRLGALRLLRSLDPGADLRTLTEALTANPHDPMFVLGLVGRAPYPSSVLERLAKMLPPRDAGEVKGLVKTLDADLKMGDLGQKIRDGFRERKVAEADIDRFFGAFAEVREAMGTIARTGNTFQRANWQHTRVEIEHTLQFAKRLGLSPEETLVAALGSLTSDSFKDASRYELLTHNRAGAELIAPLLISRHFPKDARTERLIEGAMAVAHEHQITPALFMTGAMKAELSSPPPVDAAILDAILAKVSKPYEAPRDRGEVVFSEAEEKAMMSHGIPGWAVPDPDAPHAGATQAAIAGDVWQYGSDEGIMKIAADLRYPGHEGGPHMGDPTLKQAIASCIEFSLSKGIEGVRDPELRQALERIQADARLRFGPDGPITQEMDRRLRANPALPADKPIPYWDENVPVAMGALNDAQSKAVEIVRDTFRRVVSDLGGVPLDPFGTYKGESR